MELELGEWISTHPSIIIVDDLPTWDDLPMLPGQKRSLVFHPGLPVDLGALPAESVAGSKILKKLMNSGTIVRFKRVT